MAMRRWPILILLAALALVFSACQSGNAQAEPPADKQGTANLFLMVDMVQGSKNISKADAPTRSCVLTNRFPRNSQIVWRARVFDPKTGQLMDDQALSKVEVRLADGKTVDMKYGAHPKDPPGESYWTGSYLVPKDQATGTLDYSVVATAADGRSGEFKPFNVSSSLLTITDEVLASTQ